MTLETETILIKFLERIEAEAKETNQKLDKFIETTKESLTKIQITQGIQGEQIKALTENVKELKDESKEVKSDIKGRISIQTYWFLLLISLLVGIVGKFAFYPNP